MWSAISDCKPIEIGARLIDAFGDDITQIQKPVESSLSSEFRLILSKPDNAERASFFTVKGLRAFLDESKLVDLPSYIEVANNFESFYSGTTLFISWGTDFIPAVSSVMEGDAPRRLVRDLSGDLVPSRAGPWIFKGNSLPLGDVPDAFALAAARTLPFTLVTEAWRDGDTPRISLKGDRTVSAAAPAVAEISRGDHAALNDVATWVYGHSDTEVRHTLFANEAARLWRDQDPWTGASAARLSSALLQARVAYGHHLRAQAKDAVKALVDLRKAVGEEVEKAAAQTRELAGTLWRDFAVAAGALAIRFIGLPTSTSSGRASSLLLLGTAGFVAYSFCLSVWIHQRFYRHSKQLRADWHERLYGFLGKEEFDKLAVEPLRQVRMSYRVARLWISFAYLAVIVVLVWQGAQIVSGDSEGGRSPTQSLMNAPESSDPLPSSADELPVAPLPAGR